MNEPPSELTIDLAEMKGLDIPPTPRLARNLFARSDSEKSPPSPQTAEEKRCRGEPFHITVSRLLFQALPSLEFATIISTVKEFFGDNHITTEDGLSSLIPSDDLPLANTCDKESYWQIVIFRRAMSTVISGCCQFHLLPNTPYSLLLQHSRAPTSSVVSDFTPTPTKVYSVKTVATVSLTPFSGLTSDFKDWFDSVANAYGICGHQCFLDSEKICTDNDPVSYSIKCNLSAALKNGTLAYLCEEMKAERNAFVFLQGIRSAADEKADHRNREFKQWLDLFTQTLKTPDDCFGFINKFSLSISALKEAKSAAVQDDVLLRALLLQAIQCEDFTDVKLEITKDLDMKPDAIIKSLKAHKLALDSEEIISDGRSTMTSPRQVRRGHISDGASKFGDTKPTFRIPRWPRGLYEVCTGPLWKQLTAWKMLVNKEKLNDDERKRLREFTIQQDRPDSDTDQRHNHQRPQRTRRYDDRPPPRDDRRPIDRSRDGSLGKATRFADKRNRDESVGRSSRTNRHSNDDRRVRRRSTQCDSSDAEDYPDDDYSASSLHSGAITSRRSHRSDSEDPDPAARRVLMGGAPRR